MLQLEVAYYIRVSRVNWCERRQVSCIYREKVLLIFLKSITKESISARS